MNLFTSCTTRTHRFLLILALFAISYSVMGQSSNVLSPNYQQSNKITNDLELTAVVNGSLHHTEHYRNLSISVGPALSYYLGRVVYLTSSFQHYIVSQKSKKTDETYNTQEQALYIGGGYMQQLGNRTYMQIGATYNVLYKNGSSIFSSGFVPNVGIVVGL